MGTPKFKVDRFSFAELCSNSTGKTSGSGTAGIYIVLIGGICFLLGCVDLMFFDKSTDILSQSIVMVTIGSALLGYRKSKDSDTKEPEEENTNIENNTVDKPLNS